VLALRGFEQSRRVGQEGDDAQEQQIHADENPVERHDVAEDPVMAEPEESDHEEADPEAHQAVPVQMTILLSPQVDGEQGYRDREDGVAEEQDPVVFDEP